MYLEAVLLLGGLSDLLWFAGQSRNPLNEVLSNNDHDELHQLFFLDLTDDSIGVTF